MPPPASLHQEGIDAASWFHQPDACHWGSTIKGGISLSHGISANILGLQLNLNNVLCLRPSVGLFYIKTHAIPFREALVPLHVDRRVMDEQVLPLFTFDKTITLVRIKPLYYSLCQSDDLLSYTLRSDLVHQVNLFRKP
jgi:hypothetical protein